MPTWFLLAAALSSHSAATQPAAVVRLMDDAQADLQLWKAIGDARDAVAAKDSRRLSALMAPDVAFGPGPERSPDRLIAHYGLGQGDSGTWDELAFILRTGGGFGSPARDSLVMPFVAAIQHVAIEPGWCVATDRVSVYAARSTAGEVIGELTGELIPIVAQESTDAWLAVRFDYRGRLGFVERRYCRGSTDLRIHFGKTAQGWRITAIVAGDS